MPLDPYTGLAYLEEGQANTIAALNAWLVELAEMAGGGGPSLARGNATLSGGTVTVLSAFVGATSQIMLTGQDDNVSGSLRVSSRIVGVNFTIASSNGADSGVVGWVLF